MTNWTNTFLPGGVVENQEAERLTIDEVNARNRRRQIHEEQQQIRRQRRRDPFRGRASPPIRLLGRHPTPDEQRRRDRGRPAQIEPTDIEDIRQRLRAQIARRVNRRVVEMNTVGRNLPAMMQARAHQARFNVNIDRVNNTRVARARRASDLAALNRIMRYHALPAEDVEVEMADLF